MGFFGWRGKSRLEERKEKVRARVCCIKETKLNKVSDTPESTQATSQRITPPPSNQRSERQKKKKKTEGEVHGR